jgi:hypothetical protein
MEKETTMFKTISAALVAFSVIAAPALAAAPGKTTQAPANKTTQAPVIKADQAKSKALNANARMGRHHTKQVLHPRHHKKVAMHKAHVMPKPAIKPAASTAKRG